MSKSMPNAIGEIIPIAFVNDILRRKVKINPNNSINVITPNTMTLSLIHI